MTRRAPTRRRVALVTTAGEAGGAERVIELLAARLAAHGTDPVLAAPVDSALLSRWAAAFETMAIPVPLRLRRVDQAARVIAGITRALASASIDLVHTHGVATHIHAGLAARRAGLPAVYHVHDIFEPAWSADGALQRLALRMPAARVIAISDTVAASLVGRVAASRITTIDNGVDATLVDAVGRGETAGVPLVVWCGRLQHWKGPQHFIAAAARVHATRPDVRFALVGGALFGMEPECAPALRRQAQEAGVADALTFVGHVDDARPWLRAASVVVHCSERAEPFGLVMAEAMMQERPVVAFDRGGAAEIVADGETGRLVSPGDAAALADATIALLDEPARAARWGIAGRARALQRFDADLMTASVCAVYDSVAPRHA